MSNHIVFLEHTGGHGLVEGRAADFAGTSRWNTVVRYRERSSTEGKSEVAQKPAQIRGNFAVFVGARRICPYFLA